MRCLRAAVGNTLTAHLVQSSADRGIELRDREQLAHEHSWDMNLSPTSPAWGFIACSEAVWLPKRLPG